MENKKWDYKVYQTGMKFRNAAGQMENDLKSLGAQGWELVSVQNIGGTTSFTCFLKKEII